MDQQQWDHERQLEKQQAEAMRDALSGAKREEVMRDALAGAQSLGGSPAPNVPTAAFILERIEVRRDQLLKELATIELAAENLRKMPELAQLYEAMIQVQGHLGIR